MGPLWGLSFSFGLRFFAAVSRLAQGQTRTLIVLLPSIAWTAFIVLFRPFGSQPAFFFPIPRRMPTANADDL